jgi:hypothetical protein
MRIKLLPQRRGETVSMVKTDDTVVINGTLLDFRFLASGERIPAIDDDSPTPPHELITAAERIGDELVLHVILPHGANPGPHIAFPADLVDVPNGNVVFPL